MKAWQQFIYSKNAKRSRYYELWQEFLPKGEILFSLCASQIQNIQDARMRFKIACVRTGRDFARRLRSVAGIKGQAGGSDTYRTRRTSRHVAVALYTNSIMHARANINYCGFNIGRRRWPWPTTSWKHVKCGRRARMCVTAIRDFSIHSRNFSEEDPIPSTRTITITCILQHDFLYICMYVQYYIVITEKLFSVTCFILNTD